MTNETIKNLLTRRSIKKYKSQQITDEELNTVLEAGEYAPSGMNMQSPLFIAVQNRETVAKLSKMNAAIMGTNGDTFYGAPTVVIVFSDKNKSTCIEDGSLAIGNMCNAAHAIGLGSCWIHRAREMFESAEGKVLLKEWGVNDNYIGIGCCILGYADEEKAASPRKEGRVTYIR